MKKGPSLLKVMLMGVVCCSKTVRLFFSTFINIKSCLEHFIDLLADETRKEIIQRIRSPKLFFVLGVTMPFITLRHIFMCSMFCTVLWHARAILPKVDAAGLNRHKVLCVTNCLGSPFDRKLPQNSLVPGYPFKPFQF